MAGKVKEVNISHEMKAAFLDYAMSVIVSRALPDVRDGLKPVHRRILYTMYELGMTPDKQYKKSARVVGNVNAQYHPHGEVAIYDAMVRMAQDFSYRYVLIDGHGNFGSIDGDSPAAMRYTEARMAPITLELLRDIQKDTIDFVPNYDGQQQEPVVLPSRFPNLLVNGSSGIAVGMATNIPPHNLKEIIDAILLLIAKPAVTIEELLEVVKGPDFPTGGIILGKEGIKKSYATGKGSINIRAKTTFEELAGGKIRIVVQELPYQVNKARLVEKIAELVRERKIEGITDLRDESDRRGMRVVIELKKDINPNVVLNKLFKYTALQTSFGFNMLALVDGKPKVLNLKETLYFYLQHQIEVITRRTSFDLKKAEERAHILKGYLLALDQIDDVIELIKKAANVSEAKEGLMLKFKLTAIQAQAILDMRLQRLTALERDKIAQEYLELEKQISYLKDLLSSEDKIRNVVKEELTEIKEKYGDKRRTVIINEDGTEFLEEDLIPEDNVVIILTDRGYIKRMSVSVYKAQKRGGKGVTGIGTKEGDFVKNLFVTSTHDKLLFFSNKGKVYILKTHEVPEFSRLAKGTPVINLIDISTDERIQALIPVKEFTKDNFLFFCTKYGLVKKTKLLEFSNIRKKGIFAINLKNKDELIGVYLTNGKQDIILGTRLGMSIRFNETDVREMGRTATGVKGITLDEKDEVIDMDVISEDKDVLIVTKKGYGKRTPLKEYRLQARGGKGIKTLNITPLRGEVVSHKVVAKNQDLMIVTHSGMIIRLKTDEIPIQGRYAMGVKLINVSKPEDEVSTVAFTKEEES